MSGLLKYITTKIRSINHSDHLAIGIEFERVRDLCVKLRKSKNF